MDLGILNEIRDTITDFNTNYGYYFRDSTIVLDRLHEINFRDNYYFYDIPLTHLKKNSKLEQTIGWPGGTFDPLQ